MHRDRRILASAVASVIGAAAIAVQAATPAPAPADAFFDDSQVHSIYLAINSRDWQSLTDHPFENTYYPADFKWGTQVVRNIGVRSRGTGSRYGGKPGLRVDFDRYTTDQVFLGTQKSIVLRNQTQDPSNMRERISMLLFRRLGVEAPREAYARLYINNAYAGLYTIVESVDKPFLKRTYGENDGHLYKFDYNVDDQPWYFEDRGLEPDAYVPSPFKPETHENDPRPEPIVDLVRIVNNDSDAVFRTRVDPYLKWPNFITHIAIENCIADQDGFNGFYGMNNFYWYRWENKNVFTWIPWDKSEAFKGGADLSIFRNFLDGEPAKRNRLSGRAMTEDDLRSMYLDTLLECAKALRQIDPETPDDARGWMEREIDRQYQQIRDLVYADTKKPFTNDDFEQDVQALRAFARERPPFIETAVADFRRR